MAFTQIHIHRSHTNISEVLNLMPLQPKHATDLTVDLLKAIQREPYETFTATTESKNGLDHLLLLAPGAIISANAGLTPEKFSTEKIFWDAWERFMVEPDFTYIGRYQLAALAPKVKTDRWTFNERLLMTVLVHWMFYARVLNQFDKNELLTALFDIRSIRYGNCEVGMMLTFNKGFLEKPAKLNRVAEAVY